ncbi:hypothetical protein CF336_g8691 [Tilletia laevis]|nr:hypothetical protein CF336_g8691 [Tilletia laevis]
MVRQGAAGRSCTFPTRTSPSSSGSGRSTDSARYHPYSINDSYIPTRPKHTTSATPTTLLSSGSPGSPVSKPIIKSKILAKDRMLALAPISGDQPVLRTTSGFNFDPHGCHWQAVKRILSTRSMPPPAPTTGRVSTTSSSLP